MKIRRSSKYFFLLSFSCLVACSGINEKGRATDAINAGLQKNPVCQEVPVEISAKKEVLENSPVIELLLRFKLIQPGQVEEAAFIGNPRLVDGYVFTELGKPLVTRPGSHGRFKPCLKTGVWKINRIEAIDYGSDQSGQQIANVRATIDFSPEEWFAASKNDPKWAFLWTGIERQQRTQWMYRLVKSGDQFFYSKPGVELKQ